MLRFLMVLLVSMVAISQAQYGYYNNYGGYGGYGGPGMYGGYGMNGGYGMGRGGVVGSSLGFLLGKRK